jgi:hypothetical protein
MTLQRLQANQAWDKISENVLNSWVRQLELISSSVSAGDSRIAALSSSVSVINATAAFLAQANTFTAVQAITVPSTGAALTITSTDAGAGEGPVINLFRESASPAANDVIPAIRFGGRDSGGNSETYAGFFVVIVDPTAGSEDARLFVRTRRAGADSDWYFDQGTLRHSTQTLPSNAGEIAAAAYKVGANQVVGARITGWGDPFGAISRATFSTTTATTNQVAQALAALITDLKAHGLIGS